MPFINEVRHDPLIVISRFSGNISPEDFEGWNAANEALQTTTLQHPGSKLYVIMDVREATADFTTVLRQMTTVSVQTASPDVFAMGFHLMFVGDAPMAKLAVELGKRKDFFGGVEIPMFRTVEDALAYIEVDHQQHGQAQPNQTQPNA